MTRDDYIKLHRQTVEAIDLVDKHGFENCVIETTDNIGGDYWARCDWMPHFDARFYRARLKPQPKLVPWSSLDEVPLTHWFRQKGTLRLLRVESIDSVSTAVPLRVGDRIVSLRDLHDEHEHAAPCDKHSNLIWLPCGKEVVE